MKILVLEDSIVYQQFIIKNIKEHLPDAKYLKAKDGEEGYQLYLKEKPDFILLDLLLPGKKGQEVLKLIKEDDPEARVIVISADVQEIVQKEVEELGALKFINKPLTQEKTEEIAKLIKEYANA